MSDDLMPEDPITILLITKDDHIFTGTAYMYTLETTIWEDKIQTWDLKLTGTNAPTWIPLRKQKGKEALYTIAQWFINTIRKYK